MMLSRFVFPRLLQTFYIFNSPLSPCVLAEITSSNSHLSRRGFVFTYNTTCKQVHRFTHVGKIFCSTCWFDSHSSPGAHVILNGWRPVVLITLLRAVLLSMHVNWIIELFSLPFETNWMKERPAASAVFAQCNINVSAKNCSHSN